MNNPNCDGSGPCDPGRVRVLPLPAAGYAALHECQDQARAVIARAALGGDK